MEHLTSSSCRRVLHPMNFPCLYILQGMEEVLVYYNQLLPLRTGAEKFSIDLDPLSLPSSSLSQPVPLDIDGDMKIDLLGLRPGSSSLKVWQNVWNASDPSQILYNVCVNLMAPYCWKTSLTLCLSINPPFSGNQCKISNPHSNAVIDLNGDCLAGMSNSFWRISLV